MKVTYTNAPCGAGKSYTSALRMLNIQGRYLVVRDRVEAMDEYMALISRMNRSSIRLEMISSKDSKSVRVSIESLPERYNEQDHAIVLITHTALMMCDMSGFEGWHCIVDETPPVLNRQDVKSAASFDFFDDHYELQNLQDGWSSVTLTDRGWHLTPRDLHEDDLVGTMRNFHERVTMASPLPDDANARSVRRSVELDQRQAVIVNLTQWQDMTDGRTWSWFSEWSPMVLRSFASVEFMANGFQESFTFELWRSLHPEIEWIERQIVPYRSFEPRHVTIEYFTNQHNASAYLFDSSEGRNNLLLIERYLATGERIWMANGAHADALLKVSGERLSPRKAGSNAYAGIDHAACIYSAKPRNEAKTVFGLLGVDPETWVKTHEYETILQFVCRTSIRNPDSKRPCHFTVYDLNQASYLKRYFDAQPHVTCSMELVDLGFANQQKDKGGRPKLELTDQDREERAKRKAEQNREAGKRYREKKKAGRNAL